MKSFLLLCCLTVCFVSVFPQKAVSQNETGSRSLNEKMFKDMGYWYDSTTAMYQTRYPIIRSIPPLTPSMPFDIMFSYIAADSLCRFAHPKDVHTLIKSWASMNDTLRYAVQYLYKMKDYNPIIFNQYQDQITLLRKNPFKTSLLDIKNALEDKYVKYVPQNERNAIYSMLGADYILRVKIQSIDSIPNKVSRGMIRYRVTAQIIDTLKGKTFQTASCGYNKQVADNFNPFPCMYFQYTSNNYFDPSSTIGDFIVSASLKADH